MLHRLAPALFTSRPTLPLDIPGPEPGRFLSTGGALLPWAADSLGHAGRLFERYGRVVALVRGGGTRHIAQRRDCPGTVLCYGADLNQLITSKHDVFAKGNLSGSLYPGADPKERKRPLLSFGSGLFSVNGDDHKRHRRLLAPVFSRRRLAAYCEQMALVTQAELSSWVIGEDRDISKDMRVLTAKVVTRTLFGEGAPLHADRASGSLKEVLGLMGKPLTKLFTFDLPGFPYHRYLNAATELERQVQALIVAQKGSSAERDDMLSALIRARDEESGSQLSEQEILGHISVFFAAGHETTAHALCWTLLLLASFPEVARKVDAELASVLKGQVPAFEELEQLSYLGSVIKESLRLFTPAPWNGRLLSEDVELDGYRIPQGSEILFSIYQTHRSEAIYHDPYDFVPERWEHIAPSPYEYSPFSAGPRTCIGAMFAQLEMKIVLSLILTNYRLMLRSTSIHRFAEMVLAPRDALIMKVQARDGRFEQSSQPFSGDVHEMVRFNKELDARKSA